jgi:hypothetical protein
MDVVERPRTTNWTTYSMVFFNANSTSVHTAGDESSMAWSSSAAASFLMNHTTGFRESGDSDGLNLNTAGAKNIGSDPIELPLFLVLTAEELDRLAAASACILSTSQAADLDQDWATANNSAPHAPYTHRDSDLIYLRSPVGTGLGSNLLPVSEEGDCFDSDSKDHVTWTSNLSFLPPPNRSPNPMFGSTTSRRLFGNNYVFDANVKI